MPRPSRVGLVHQERKPKPVARADKPESTPSVLDLPRLDAHGSLRTDRLSHSNVIALQRTVGNQAVIQLLRERPGADGARPRNGRTRSPLATLDGGKSPETLRRDPETEMQEWQTAQNVYMNMPIDAGHITGKVVNWGIVRPIMSKLKGKQEWREREKGAWEKAHLIEKNQYGRGKLGAVMRGIDTASRLCHLGATIAGIIAFICGIVGFFQPAALPVGAIATAIALGFHGVMAILQSILIGHNLIRIKGMPPEERAKVMPAIYRDLTKLVYALVGVGLGGLGVGMSVAHGGLMAANALTGAEQSAKIGEFVGEQTGDALSEGGLFWGILGSNQKEVDLGMQGKLNLPKHDGHQPEPTPPEPRRGSLSTSSSSSVPKGGESSNDQDLSELDALSKSIKSDSDDGREHVNSAKVTVQDGASGVDGLSQDARQLDQVSSNEDKLKQAQGTVDQISKANESDNGEKLKDQEQVKQKAKELAKIDEQSEDSEDVSSSGSKTDGSKKKAQTKPVDGTVQREPSKLQKFKAWLKRKFSGIKKRVARAIAKLQAKLTELVMHVVGIKQFQTELEDALVEKRQEAAAMTAAVNEAQEASSQYSEASAQFAQNVAKARETAGKK